MKKLGLVLGVILVCTAALQATTVSLTFGRITANSAEDVAGQLSVDVIDAGATVEFKFYNNGPVASSISEIYFYDGVLLNMSSVDDSHIGVDFEDVGEKVNPPALPGYTPDQALLEVFSAIEAENPESTYGVRPGEWLTISYTLQSGKGYADLLTDLTTADVVIGLHVKSIGAGGDSDSFISYPVPEPATICLLGLGGIVLRRKRRA